MTVLSSQPQFLPFVPTGFHGVPLYYPQSGETLDHIQVRRTKGTSTQSFNMQQLPMYAVLILG